MIARRLALTGIGLAFAAVAVVLSGFLIRFGLAPLADHLAALLNTASGVPEPKILHSPPYGAGLLVVIYLTFIEPTLATFCMAKLSWWSLPGGRATKATWFTLLILGCSGRLTLLFLNSFWVQQPAALAFASTGQFVAETAVMAALVGWLASRPRSAR